MLVGRRKQYPNICDWTQIPLLLKQPCSIWQQRGPILCPGSSEHTCKWKNIYWTCWWGVWSTLRINNGSCQSGEVRQKTLLDWSVRAGENYWSWREGAGWKTDFKAQEHKSSLSGSHRFCCILKSLISICTELQFPLLRFLYNSSWGQVISRPWQVELPGENGR